MWLVTAGWIASGLVFSTFFMKTMLPLRLVAIASNVGFMTYALLGLATATSAAFTRSSFFTPACYPSMWCAS